MAEPAPGAQPIPGSAEGIEAQASGAFPPFATETFPSQLLWLAITFGILYYVMSRVALPRIASILEVRKDRVAADLDEANRLDEEGRASVAAYEQELATARAEGQATAQKARDDAKARSDAARARAEAELDERLAASEARIAEVRAQALQQVDTIAADTAEALMEQLAPVRTTRGEVEAAIRAERS